MYIGSRYGLVLRSILMADHQLPKAKNMMANTTQQTLTVIGIFITSSLGLVTFYWCQLTANMRHYFLLICPTQHCKQKMRTSWYFFFSCSILIASKTSIPNSGNLNLLTSKYHQIMLPDYILLFVSINCLCEDFSRRSQQIRHLLNYWT